MKRNKTILIILILLFPTILSLGSFITNVRGGPDIPIDDPNNNWHWGVDVGDMIILESEITLTDLNTKEVLKMVRNNEIYNITSFSNTTGDIMGLHPDQQFSVVMAEILWEDSVGALSPFGGLPLAYFGYNDTLSKEFYVCGSASAFPIIFPLNDSVLDISLMASIHNETYLTPMAEDKGFFNNFNDFSYDIGKTEIYFQNTTDNYYFRASYYANNGTIKDVEAFYLVNMGTLVLANLTAKRVFNFDVTDELEWGVDIGETYYYYFFQGGSGSSLVKFEVEDFSKSVYWSKNWTIYPNDWPMVFENVIVSMSAWNGTGWQTILASSPLAAANNFYPECLPLIYSLGGQSGFIVPRSATLEDFMFLINNHTHDLTGWFPYDLVFYNELGNIITITFAQSGNGQIVYTDVNTDTGFIEEQIAYDMGDVLMYFKKVDDLTEWSVDIGDEIYYKQNIAHDLQQIRATITSIDYTLINMTTLGITIPSGQPNLQFFAEIYADLEVWIEQDELWYNAGIHRLAAANEYWPIAPYAMDETFPILMPKGTVATDFQNIYGMLTSIYDHITYSPGHIIVKNTSLSKELNIYFNETTGRLIYLGGDYFAIDHWIYMSVYPKNIESLSTGLNTFPFQSDLITDTTITAQLNTAGPGAVYLYAMLSENPLNVSIPIGTPLSYFDQLIINSSLITGNITMTITFPSSIDISRGDLHFFAWNISGTLQWEEPPPEYYDTVIYNYITNSIIVEDPALPFSIISAISYEYLAPGNFLLDSTAESPDDDGNFTLTWDVALGAMNYSVYEYSGYITVINGSLQIRADHTTSLSLALSEYSNGTYYFIAVAHNTYGDTLSNCIMVVVEIPPEAPEDGDGDGGGIIPGYSLYILLAIFLLFTSILIKKKRKKI